MVKRFSLRKTAYLALLVVLLTSPLVVFLPRPATALSGSDFNAGRIMDDPIFFDNTRMDVYGIQAFLNSKVPVCDNWGTQPYGGTTRRAYSESRGISFPLTCLKDYQQSVPYTPADQFCSGTIGASQKNAAQIIKEVSDACQVNPMVLIVLLQKEQSLITDDWPWPVQFQKATGFGCPDTAPCDSQYYGFFNQVYRAARQFHKYSQQPQLYNYRSGRSNYIQYNANAGCSGSNVFIQNDATAALYNYTPYQPNPAALNNLYGTGDGCSAYGNRNFWRIYSDWFGSPVTSHCFYGAPGAVQTGLAFRKLRQNLDAGSLTIYAGTGTNCIESHSWNVGFGSWQQNTASNHPVVNSADAEVKYADLDGNGVDEAVLVGYRNTGSGKVEFHVWDHTMKKWIVHVASNLPAIDPAKFMIDFADLDGDRRDDPIAIGYAGTETGKVEFHLWNSGVQTWKAHYITNLPAISLSQMKVGFADLDGNGMDEAVAIGLSGTATGKIEFHVWNPGLWDWQAHYASSHPTINSNDANVLFADLDYDGMDVAVLVAHHNTGSGKIEFHVWNPGFSSWQGHYASNQPTF